MSQVAKMKKSVCKKTIISTSIILSLGVSMDRVSYADPVASFQLKDFNSDGLMSDFGFATPPPGNSGNKFGAAGETGCLNAVDGNTCDPIDMVAGPRMPVTNNNGIDYYQVLEFTTGFNFGGGGDFNPNIAGDINATIDPSLATAGDGQAVQFGALDFGGIYQAAISPPGSNSLLDQTICRTVLVPPRGRLAMFADQTVLPIPIRCSVIHLAIMLR